MSANTNGPQISFVILVPVSLMLLLLLLMMMMIMTLTAASQTILTVAIKLSFLQL